MRLEIDKLECLSNYRSIKRVTHFEFLFLQLLFRLLDLSINALPTRPIRQISHWCSKDAHLAPDEIQSCLYIGAGFGLVLGNEDGPNKLEYHIVRGEVCKLLK